MTDPKGFRAAATLKEEENIKNGKQLILNSHGTTLDRDEAVTDVPLTKTSEEGFVMSLTSPTIRKSYSASSGRWEPSIKAYFLPVVEVQIRKLHWLDYRTTS